MIEVAIYLYRINKHSLALPCHAKETEDIVHKNMRMGIGITGYCMATEEQQSWLEETYKELRDFDVHYSKEKGFPVTIGSHTYSSYMVMTITWMRPWSYT